jgi:exopolysaccharide biosynthesis polyprenyl glycosylphosphotransferase
LVLFPAQALVTLATRGALRLGFEMLRRRGYNLRFVLVLGAGPRGRAFAEKLEAQRPLGLRVIGFLDDDPAYAVPSWTYLGPLDRLEWVLQEKVVDEVAICLPFTQWNKIDALAEICEEEGKIVRIPMDVLDRAIATGRVEDLDGTPVFSLVSGPDRMLALTLKRGLDVAVSAVGLVVLSPVFLVIGLAILADDGRPIFFRQRRVGLHGRPFDVLKFRSMAPDAEGRRPELAAHNEINGHAFKLARDPRVTSAGRMLRRMSLDELPQLWNVLRGEMSLVGPRPPLPDEVKTYDIWHRRRLSMKPGMTGLWQVRGRRDPDFDRWVAADLEYIDRWSLWLDIIILMRTIPAALNGR